MKTLSASLLSWVFFLVLVHPNVENKIRDNAGEQVGLKKPAMQPLH